jgi:hypothetical protein
MPPPPDPLPVTVPLRPGESSLDDDEGGEQEPES